MDPSDHGLRCTNRYCERTDDPLVIANFSKTEICIRSTYLKFPYTILNSFYSNFFKSDSINRLTNSVMNRLFIYREYKVNQILINNINNYRYTQVQLIFTMILTSSIFLGIYYFLLRKIELTLDNFYFIRQSKTSYSFCYK